MEILSVKEEVLSVKMGGDPIGIDTWVLEIQIPEGKITQFMPKIAVVARMAEYDLPEDDFDTAIDMLLSEPWLREDDEGENAGHLYRDVSVAAARAKHIGRCARHKLITRTSTRRANSPLSVIKEWHRQNPPDVYDYAMHQNRVFDARREQRAHSR